jgi:ketopantoate hydroxymethyltransferase
MRIDIPVPAPFYVITAKNEDGQILVLQDIHNTFVEPWNKNINEFTKRYDTKESANEILKIQTSHFPEQNRNLSVFKVQKIKVAYIFD